jgi:hypothetical protein
MINGIDILSAICYNSFKIHNAVVLCIFQLWQNKNYKKPLFIAISGIVTEK